MSSSTNSHNMDSPVGQPWLRWVILALLVFARSGIGLQFIAIAALMPIVRMELGLNYTQVGLLLGLFMVTGIFLSIPSGMIARRLGDRRTLFIGLISLIVGGGVAAASDGFGTMLAGRVLGGVGAVFITVTAAKILADWFTGREISTAMGFLGLSWPIGIALGLSLLPGLETWLGWRLAILMTIFLPMCAFIVVVMIKALGKFKDTELEAGTPKTALWSISRKELWAIVAGAFAWPLMSSGGYVVFSSYAPELLIAQGLSNEEAGLAIGLLSWLFMITIPVGGYLADRYGRGDFLFWFGCLASALAIAFVPIGDLPVLWVVLTAIMGITVGPIMALPGDLLTPASRSTGLGVYYTVYYLGTVVLPALGGWLLDVTGSPAWVVWYSSACLVTAPLSLLLCRRMQRRL